MKKIFPERQLLINLLIVIVIMVGIILVNTDAPEPTIECYVGQTQDMTIQEVASLLNFPLIELSWLPGEVEILPEVTTTRVGYSECSVNLTYREPNLDKQQILVSMSIYALNYLEPTKIATHCSWQFTPDNPLSTDCSIDLDSIKSTLRIRLWLSPDYPPEDALQILNGIKVVEPNR